MRGVTPLHPDKIRKDLLLYSRMSSQRWEQLSPKGRLRLLVKSTGLEACFAPKTVLESLCKDKDGKVISVATGRDGRILWSGETKLVRYPDTTRRFSSPWSYTSKSEKRKSARISYLFRVFSEQRLPEKAIRPLLRLCIQIWNLKMHDFVMLTRKVLSLAEHRIEPTSTRDHEFSSNGLIPYLTGKVVNSKNRNLGTVPLWDWRWRNHPG
nr:MAG: RNA-dependent RNA polymerase [Aspergillus flavus narnavirus 1]